MIDPEEYYHMANQLVRVLNRIEFLALAAEQDTITVPALGRELRKLHRTYFDADRVDPDVD